MANQTVQSLPVLSQDTNQLKNKLYNLGLNDGQIISKTILSAASDNIVENSKQFREYLTKLYELNKSENTNFQQDMQTTSSTFDVISNHISDFVREASNSSVFERADKVKIMKYIQSAIEAADINDREKRQLLEQYRYASMTLKNSAGIFDKASVMLTRNIGTFTGLIGSTFSDLPPIATFMLTKGGDFISSLLERRKTKQERLASLEDDIRIGSNTPRPSLFSSNNEVRPTLERQTNNNLDKIFDTASDNNAIQANKADKIERIRETSGSLLDKAPIGTDNDPFYVIIKNEDILSGKKKDSSFLEAIGSLKGAFDAFSSVLGGIADALGLSKVVDVGKKLLPNFSGSDTSKMNRVPDGEVPDKAKKPSGEVPDKAKTAGEAVEKKAGKQASKQAAKKTAGAIIKQVGTKAFSIASKFLGPIGAAVTAYEGFTFLDELRKNLEKANGMTAEDSIDAMEAGESGELTNQRLFEDTTKVPTDGTITGAKNSPRASLDEQSRQATKAREQAAEQRNVQVNQQNTNNSQVINNNTFNQSTTNQTNRVIQVTNPQASLVNGSR